MTPTNRLAPLSDATFAVDAALRAAAAQAGVPGVMLCARCGADHVDPAIGGTSMRPGTTDGEGWVCADDVGCGE